MRRFFPFVLFCLGFLFAVSVSAQSSPPTDAVLFPGTDSVAPVFLECVPELKEYPPDALYVAYAAVLKEKAYYTIGVNRIDPELFRQSLSESGEGGLESYHPLPPEQRHWEATVSLDQQGHCEVLIPRDGRSYESLTELMPEAAARQLQLQRMQADLVLFGEPEGRRLLKLQLESLSQDNRRGLKRTLTPEQAWAFRQLGFKVPSNVPISPKSKLSD